MYSSLTKVDIVAGEGARRLFVQTDHRSPDEVEAEPELSMLFALARTIVPRRMMKDGDPETIVRYACLQGISPTIARVLRATGPVFLISEGKITGTVQTTREPPVPEKKKSLWGRLFD